MIRDTFEPFDRRDRGMAGAEIIQINAASQRRKAGDVAGDHIVRSAGKHGFQDLDSQPVRCQVELIQFPFEAVDQAGVAQVFR